MHYRSVCVLAVLAGAGIAYGASVGSSVDAADKQFLTSAAKADMVEAHEGQMAENQAARADVKDFAKTLVQDHTQSYEHLTELAAKSGVTIPKGIDAAKERDIAPLVHLKGDRFDRAFAREEVSEHQRALAEFKREAAHGKDPDLKAYASGQIPVLEKHLHLAEACEKPAGKS
jgi:putative membrane protein